VRDRKGLERPAQADEQLGIEGHISEQKRWDSYSVHPSNQDVGWLPKHMYTHLPLSFERAVAKKFTTQQNILLSKHQDYGPRNIADAPGGALNGLRVRMHDKLARINHLIDNNAEPQHESLRDSFVDLANYAVIALLVMDGEWDSET
jgi:Nucleotide modification associated domain 1